MSLHRSSWLTAIFMVLCLAQAASAQNVQPFGPTGQEFEVEPFAPADLSQYGSGPALKRGWWFTYDRLYWSTTTPKIRDIGEEALEDVTVGDINSIDTSVLRSQFTWGNRYEGGYVMDNDQGWLASYTQLGIQFQDRDFVNTLVLFNDPGGVLPGGATGIVFGTMAVHYESKYDSVELMHTSRWDKGPRAGVFEFLLGARYINFQERFGITLNADAFNESQINVVTENHIPGAQVGLRWYNIRERWKFNVEGRFTAGANIQNVVQDGFNNSLILPNRAFTAVQHFTTFSPIGELRVETSYEITKSIALKVGYDITAIGGISRAPEKTAYTVPFFGLVNTNSHDWVILNGIAFGIEFNR